MSVPHVQDLTEYGVFFLAEEVTLYHQKRTDSLERFIGFPGRRREVILLCKWATCSPEHSQSSLGYLCYRSSLNLSLKPAILSTFLFICSYYSCCYTRRIILETFLNYSFIPNCKL